MKRILCFSAYAANLRYVALARGLRDHGYEVIASKSHGPSGSILELALTLLPNCWLALTCRADLAAGFKPHPNVTLPLWIAKLRGLPTWLDVDDLDHAYRTGWVGTLVEILQRPFPRLYTIVTYHNENLREHLIRDRHVNPDRLLRVEQGVDCRLFDGQAAPDRVAEVRRRFDLAGKPVAVYTAHLNVASDLEPVLTAWQTVVRELPAAVLLVVGGGPLRQHFENLAGQMGLTSQVHFTGEVSHGDVPAFFAVADVALLYFSPRLVNQYRCSLKLREYFAAGVKVVCNDVGELPTFAHLTYQSSSDPAAFAANIVRVLRGGGDRREQQAHDYARQQLHWPRLIEQATREIVARGGLASPD
ncbi:MAG: glycosyltransferase [Verrucomicrobiota bacterium]